MRAATASGFRFGVARASYVSKLVRLWITSTVSADAGVPALPAVPAALLRPLGAPWRAVVPPAQRDGVRPCRVNWKTRSPAALPARR